MQVSGIGWVRLWARNEDVSSVAVYRANGQAEVALYGKEAGDIGYVCMDVDLWDRVIAALQEKVAV